VRRLLRSVPARSLHKIITLNSSAPQEEVGLLAPM